MSSAISRTVHGIVHGKSIELNEDLGIADGQQVQVTVTCAPLAKEWGDGLRRCAGALASDWTAEDDRILQEIYVDRKRDTRPEVSE